MISLQCERKKSPLYGASWQITCFMLETLLTSKKSSFVGHALIILLWDLVWLNYRKLLILHFEQPAPPGSSSFFFLNLIPPTPAFLHMKKTTITLFQRLSHTLSSSVLKFKSKNAFRLHVLTFLIPLLYLQVFLFGQLKSLWFCSIIFCTPTSSKI